MHGHPRQILFLELALDGEGEGHFDLVADGHTAGALDVDLAMAARGLAVDQNREAQFDRVSVEKLGRRFTGLHDPAVGAVARR